MPAEGPVSTAGPGIVVDFSGRRQQDSDDDDDYCATMNEAELVSRFLKEGGEAP